jgi:cytoskeletal protein CcmA (bactofilin family)
MGNACRTADAIGRDSMTSMTLPGPAVAGARRSLLASDLVIEGDVVSAGPVEVQGRVTGSLRSPEVTVAGTGRIEGHVSALDLTVLGSIEGSIEAALVSLGTGAVVQAEITHDRIAIEAGARVEGALKRKA